MTLKLIFSCQQAKQLQANNPDNKGGFSMALSDDGGVVAYTDHNATGKSQFEVYQVMATVQEHRRVRNVKGEPVNQRKWKEWEFPGFDS